VDVSYVFTDLTIRKYKKSQQDIRQKSIEIWKCSKDTENNSFISLSKTIQTYFFAISFSQKAITLSIKQMHNDEGNMFSLTYYPLQQADYTEIDKECMRSSSLLGFPPLQGCL
jgi:hypothetical protein